MVFNWFKRKKEQRNEIEPYSFKEGFESLYAYFVENHPEDLDRAKSEFINLTGQFDDEYENFNVKMDDFRNWFVFFYQYQNTPFYMLEKIRDIHNFSRFYKSISSGVSSVFQIVKIRNDRIFLKDLIYKKNYQVADSSHVLSHEEGDYIQTSLFQIAFNEYTMALSVISHPNDAKSFIQKKIKKLLKSNKKNSEIHLKKDSMALLQELMMMRYQLYKYKQIDVDKIYSDRPLIKTGG